MKSRYEIVVEEIVNGWLVKIRGYDPINEHVAWSPDKTEFVETKREALSLAFNYYRDLFDKEEEDLSSSQSHTGGKQLEFDFPSGS